MKYRGASEVELQLSDRYFAFVTFHVQKYSANQDKTLVAVESIQYVDSHTDEVFAANQVLPHLRNYLQYASDKFASEYIGTHFANLLLDLLQDDEKQEQDNFETLNRSYS